MDGVQGRALRRAVAGGAWLLAVTLWAGAAQAQSAAQSLRDALKGLLPNPAQIQQAQREAEAKKADERCAALVDWAGSAPANMPAAAAPGEPSPALRLFADPAFKPVFGKAFDELSPSERQGIYNDNFLACVRSRTHGGAMRGLMGTLAPPFQDGGAPGVATPYNRNSALTAAQVTAAVRQFRSASSSVKQQLAELAALPAQPASWAAYGPRRAQIEATLRWLPPAEQAPVQASLAQAGARLAKPALDAALRPALALPDDVASLAPLRAANEQLRDFDGHAAPADLQAARAALQARQDTVQRLADAQAAAAVRLAEAQAAATLKALGPVGQCDLWAAHADDPEALSPGVADEAIDAAKAVAACEAAVQREPQTPRLAFQLARSQLKAGRYEDATEKLLAAAKLGHGGALAYLADLHVAGAPGIEADPLLARQLYEKALAAGFAPAAAVLQGYEDRTAEFQAAEKADLEAANAPAGGAGPLKAYKQPLIIEGVLARKFDAIPFREAWVKEYLYFFADNIRAICESGFTQAEVDRLKSAYLQDVMNVSESVRQAARVSINDAMSSIRQNPMAALQAAMKQQTLLRPPADDPGAPAGEDPFDESMADTEALFQRHSCGTPGLARFGKNLRAYVLNEEAPPTPPDAIMEACIREPGPTTLGPRDFCVCFASRLSNARVSQAHRRDLPRKFKTTAAAIMDIDRNRSMFRTCRGES